LKRLLLQLDSSALLRAARPRAPTTQTVRIEKFDLNALQMGSPTDPLSEEDHTLPAAGVSANSQSACPNLSLFFNGTRVIARISTDCGRIIQGFAAYRTLDDAGQDSAARSHRLIASGLKLTASQSDDAD